MSVDADPVRAGGLAASPGLPLSLVRPGATAVVRGLRGRVESRRLLGELGFVVGSEVSVVSARDGDLIVSVKGTRIALDRATARQVLTD